MRFSIAYLTSRKDPKFEWFCDSLFRQMTREDSVEIIVVDYLSWYEPDQRSNYFTSKARARQEVKVTPPKPCSWQGPHRKTKVDHFAAANARNTAMIVAHSEYIVFADDLSVLMPGWLDNVRHAVENRYFVGGAYAKVKELEVEDGEMTHYSPYDGGKDGRIHLGSTGGIKKVTGDFLYGCSFGAPLDAMLDIGGMDEACNGMGFEDVCFGLRMANSGRSLFYNVNMLTWESEELHSTPGNAHFIRHHYPTTAVNFQAPPGGKNESDWYMLIYARNNKDAFWPGEKHWLVEQRRHYQRTGEFMPSTVTHNWADGRPLGEL